MSEARDAVRRTEAVGVFDDAASLQAAIDALLSAGFDRAELSLLADEDTVERKLGAHYRRVEGLEDDPNAPRAAYVSTESVGDAEGGLIGGLFYVGAATALAGVVATGGSLAAMLTAAAGAGAAGGAIGAVLARLIDERRARALADQLAHGGLLLWVRTRDQAHETRALDLLRRNGARDAHVHELSPP